MKQAVLLLAHGAPERVGGRRELPLASCAAAGPAIPQVLEEVRHRYAAIGGSSPAALLDPRAGGGPANGCCDIPVFFGMRNWHPFIRETMQQVRDSGAGQAGRDLPGAAVLRAERGPLHQAHRGGQARGSGVTAEFVVGQNLPRRAVADRGVCRETAAAGGARAPSAVHRAQPAGKGAGQRRPLRPRDPRHGRRGGRDAWAPPSGISPTRARA